MLKVEYYKQPEQENDKILEIYDKYKHLDGPLSLNPPWREDLSFELNILSDIWLAIKGYHCTKRSKS